MLEPLEVPWLPLRPILDSLHFSARTSPVRSHRPWGAWSRA